MKWSKNCGNFETLVVDDDRIVCLLHKRVLKKIKIEDPVICSNGKKAIEHLDKQCNKVGSFVVLLDIHMPVMNGWEFLECCKRKPYADRIFVVIVTSSISRADLTKALEYKQVIDFCNKPFSNENIRSIQLLNEVKAFWKSSWDEKEGSKEYRISDKLDW